MIPTIRPAELADADAIASVHVRAWQEAYRGLVPQPYLDGLDVGERTALWRSILTGEVAVDGIPGPADFVVETPDGVVGFANVGRFRDQPSNAVAGELWAMYVDPDQWGSGVGDALMAATLEELRRIGTTVAHLWVLEGNQRAIRFYERHGWSADGGTTMFEAGGVDVPEIRMSRSIDQGVRGEHAGDPVEIVDYDAGWIAAFDTEAERLAAALGPWLVEIEHVGSTAVPGLAAKPVIDIQVGVTSLEHESEIIAAVVGCGYEYVPEYEVDFPDRRYFRRSERGRRTHQIHLVERSNRDWWDRHIAFRDRLRSHPETRDAYAELKRRLAATHRNDRVAYTDAKSDFIAAVLAEPA